MRGSSVFLMAVAASLWSASASRADGPPSPSVAWRHAASGWGEPTVDRGLAFFLGRQHELIALDPTNGRLRWRVATGGSGDAPLGSVIRVGGSVVVTGDGAIVAVERDDGRPAWRFAPSGDAPGPYLGEVAAGRVYAGSILGRLYALDVATGRPKWSARLSGRRPAIVFAPVVQASVVIASYSLRSAQIQGGIAAFDPAGRRLWHRKLPPGVTAAGPPVIVGNLTVTAGSDGALFAWDIGTGRLRWQAGALPAAPERTSSLDMRPLAAVPGLVVAGSTTGRLVAYDGRTGVEKWCYRPPSDMAVLRLRAVGSRVYAPYTDDSLLAIDVDTGHVVWRAGGPELRLEWPPAADGGLAFAAGIDTLIAWEIGRVAP
jgi:outer membrane protein assembly factor BamB